MRLHLTLKLAKKLKVASLAAPGKLAAGLDSWYANLFRLGHTQYILVTNEASLLSIVLPGRGVTSPVLLSQFFVDDLSEYLQGKGLWDGYRQAVAAPPGPWDIFKTANRSVLGSMNEFVFLSQNICRRDEDFEVLTDYLNRVPCGGLGYARPIDVFISLVHGAAAKG